MRNRNEFFFATEEEEGMAQKEIEMAWIVAKAAISAGIVDMKEFKCPYNVVNHLLSSMERDKLLDIGVTLQNGMSSTP